MSDRRSSALILSLALLYVLGPWAGGLLHDDGSAPAALGERGDGDAIVTLHHDSGCAICVWAALPQTPPDSGSTACVELSPTDILGLPVEASPIEAPFALPHSRGPPLA